MDANVAYALDAADRIIFVNAAWTAFAEKNDGHELVPPAVLGRSLWDFVRDPAMRHIYGGAYARVRAGFGPVTFPFRCDSPGLRRHLEMIITARPNARLDIVVRTLRLEAREPVALLDRRAARSVNVLRMCAWCKRVRDEQGAWIEVEEALSRRALLADADSPLITHGMCQECHAQALDAADGNEP
jgi:hypothetical protein